MGHDWLPLIIRFLQMFVAPTVCYATGFYVGRRIGFADGLKHYHELRRTLSKVKVLQGQLGKIKESEPSYCHWCNIHLGPRDKMSSVILPINGKAAFFHSLCLKKWKEKNHA